MTNSVKTLRILIIVGGILGGVCHVDVALSETVQIHTPTVQIHTPIIHAPKIPQIHTTTTTKINSKVISKTDTTTSAGTANTTGRSNTGSESQLPPQGVRFNQSKNGKITVTIDGKTLPMNKETAQLIKEAETPPPKMWLNGKLVPVTQANMKAAKEEEVKEIDAKIGGKSGSTSMDVPKLGGK